MGIVKVMWILRTDMKFQRHLELLNSHLTSAIPRQSVCDLLTYHRWFYSSSVKMYTNNKIGFYLQDPYSFLFSQKFSLNLKAAKITDQLKWLVYFKIFLILVISSC